MIVGRRLKRTGELGVLDERVEGGLRRCPSLLRVNLEETLEEVNEALAGGAFCRNKDQ